jgi:ubiquinone biosynthesis protein UbiJ
MILASLNRALQRATAESARAQQLCHELEGRSLRVVVTGSPWTVLLLCADGLPQLLVDDPRAADATVRGGAISLLAMLREDSRAVIQRGAVQIDGDAELAQRFSELAALLRPDPEHQTARLIGPVPAHLLARGAQGLAGWGRHAIDAVLRNGAEYLAHESRDLVPRAEAEHLLRGIEQLRERVDRLDARLAEADERVQRLARSGTESRA